MLLFAILHMQLILSFYSFPLVFPSCLCFLSSMVI
nr:MAG TPA: hypothetical protein [Caudoviricetes sp.]